MKILLLTDVPPCTNFTAGIFLDQLISFLPIEKISCFIVLNRSLDPIYPDHLAYMPIKIVPKPREDWGANGTKIGRYRSWIMEHLITWEDIPRISDEVARFGQEQGADALWCVLQGQTMIRLARPSARRLGIPLLTQVWDPPGWWMRANRVHPSISKNVLVEFGEVIQNSAATGTASWAMAEEYKSKYGANSIPFLPSLAPNLAFPPATKTTSNRFFTIGMAGQIYATAEWNALIQALNTVSWRLAGREVRIRLLGRWAGLAANDKMNIEFLGWRSQEETIQLLSQVDVLYCPYWFDPEFNVEARLSFPSKLTSYLAAGRPVFFHGPEYASPARFLEQRGAGVCCYSLNQEAIIGLLTQLIENKSVYRNIAKRGHEAFLECLTLPVLKENFQQFITAGSRF